MKLTMTLLCIAAAAVVVGQPDRAFAFTEKSTFDRRPMMNPTRRLGLLPVVHNLVDARKNLSDQMTMKGVLAQPLASEDFSSRFNSTLKSVADASGRFWTMDALPAEMVSGRSPSGSDMSSFQRAQLVKEYDLDGWLRAEIFFTADHTAIRLALVGPQLKTVVAREDVLLPFGADWDSLANAFAQALGRMSETIGHDGRVVFENAELFGIDFGTERGLSNGQRLRAGVVVQSAAHPQTGEVLRYQRYPLYELEVVDAKQGAALCRKIAVNPDLLKQAESSYGQGTDRKFPMLVWRDTATLDQASQSSSWKTQSTSIPRADATSAGFVSRENATESLGGSAVRSLSAAPQSTNSAPKSDETKSSLPQMAMLGQDSLSGSAYRRPSESFLSSMKVYAGSSHGTLELSKGPVSSSLPAYLVNTVRLQDGFRYAGEWNIRYGAEYAMFSQDVSGSRFSFRGSGTAPASTLQIPDFPMNWGAEAQYSTGTVKTAKSKKTLDAFELFGVLNTERALDGGWGLGIDYKQSFTGLLAGAFAFEAGIEIQPGAPAPKELGIQWRYIDDGDRWTEWMLGVSWKLGGVD
jgi:hypothetical protein